MSDRTATVDLSVSTVTNCFTKGLPQLRRSSLSYKLVQASSKTTEAAISPWVLLCKEGTAVRATADHYLQSKSIMESSLVHQPLGTEFMQITLNNETELVFASILYIIKPILDVLQHLYGEKKFSVSSEQTSKMENLEKDEKAVRVDMVFRTNDKDREVILVLEYKRREQIKYGDFSRALLPVNASADEIKNKEADATRADKHSLLARNALSYTKQVTMYAK